MRKGKFITIEGQDGAGKSTNAAVISDFLSAKGVQFVQTREPGGTMLGEKLRDVLLNFSDGNIEDNAELLMVFAARVQHVSQVILPALNNGTWVLCDRFTDASYAYQGGGRGLEMTHIAALERITMNGLQPDLTILLDLPVEMGESRAGQRSTPDRFEQQNIEFKQRVRDCYLERAKSDIERIKIVDAGQTLEAVQQSITDILNVFCSPYV